MCIRDRNNDTYSAYNRIEQQVYGGNTPVVRIIGFMMFWIAVGMIIGLLIAVSYTHLIIFTEPSSHSRSSAERSLPL